VHRWLSIVILAAAAYAGDTPSALESDTKGWTDLTPKDPAFKSWERVPDAKSPELSAESPWKIDRDRGVVVCNGDKAGHEYLQYRGREYSDFILHAEWRFIPVEGNPRYNSGILIRTSADQKIWHQAQTGLAGGFLFGVMPVDGELKRLSTQRDLKENRIKPAGEWNVYEITARGHQLSLWINGAVVSEMETPVDSGFIALEGEGFRVEFRNVQIKALN
jgi:Domain of Unknown Function (DUF1080)